MLDARISRVFRVSKPKTLNPCPLQVADFGLSVMLDARISRVFRVSKPKTLNPCPLQVADFGLSVMLDARILGFSGFPNLKP
jgi:succinate-acetate transporter protein